MGRPASHPLRRGIRSQAGGAEGCTRDRDAGGEGCPRLPPRRAPGSAESRRGAHRLARWRCRPGSRSRGFLGRPLASILASARPRRPYAPFLPSESWFQRMRRKVERFSRARSGVRLSLALMLAVGTAGSAGASHAVPDGLGASDWSSLRPEGPGMGSGPLAFCSAWRSSTQISAALQGSARGGLRFKRPTRHSR